MKVCGKNITKYDGLVVLSQSSIRMKRPHFIVSGPLSNLYSMLFIHPKAYLLIQQKL